MFLFMISPHLLPFPHFLFTLITDCTQTPNGENNHPEAIMEDVVWKPHFLHSFANCFSNAQSDQGIWVIWKHYSCLEVEGYNSWLRHFANYLVFSRCLIKKYFGHLCAALQKTPGRVCVCVCNFRIILLFLRHAWALNILIKGSFINLSETTFGLWY